jgi:hypothetical protein
MVAMKSAVTVNQRFAQHAACSLSAACSFARFTRQKRNAIQAQAGGLESRKPALARAFLVEGATSGSKLPQQRVAAGNFDLAG